MTHAEICPPPTMLKRPLNEKFSGAILDGRKITTIRDKAWPIGVPIMLYNWSGPAYRSRQRDVATVIVDSVVPIKITRRDDGGMLYAYGPTEERPIHQTEGFGSRREMDDWFRPLIKPGQTVTMALMRFRHPDGHPQPPHALILTP